MQPPLLDLGCGFGLLLAHAGEQGIQATGLELLEDRVSDCRSRGLDVRRADLAEPLPFPDGSFGMAYCGQVIEHLPEAAKMNIFRETLRVLRPAGQFQCALRAGTGRERGSRGTITSSPRASFTRCCARRDGRRSSHSTTPK